MGNPKNNMKFKAIYLVFTCLALAIGRADDTDDHRPMVTDEPELFEKFYGKTDVNIASGMKVRVWRIGGYVMMHLDSRPDWMAVDFMKAANGKISVRNVFALADRFCGPEQWDVVRRDNAGYEYMSSDKRFAINFYFWQPADKNNTSAVNEHVTLTYMPLDDQIKRM